jgi:hypothetical protein
MIKMIHCPECGEPIEHEGSEIEKWPYGAKYEIFCNFCNLKIIVLEDSDGGQSLSY